MLLDVNPRQSESNLSGTLSSYVQLMKPGIMSLLVFEALTAMVVASGKSTQILALVWLAIAGILASGGSAALNHYLERKRDILMSRTENRPVATNKITPINALIFGVTTLVLGLAFALLVFNTITMLMILFGAISYVFVYTLYLKPRTYWNIVIGGIAGVFPALTGWAAVTGTIGWPAIFIGALVLLWTPPHFWGLSMKFKEDYVKSGYPMLSVVKDERTVIKAIVYSSVPLLPFSLLPLIIRALGDFNFLYYSIAVVMGLAFIWVDIRMLQKPNPDNAFRAFLISLPYLFILFAGMMASSVI